MTELELFAANEIFDSPKFSKREIEATGAKLEDIDYESFKKLCEFRLILGVPVYFIKNGMTTGNHRSPGHPAGKAYDVRIPKANFYTVFKAAISAGLIKFGGYWNGRAYSYHLEDSEVAAFWTGVKKAPGPKYSWNFTNPLINNPKDIKL